MGLLACLVPAVAATAESPDRFIDDDRSRYEAFINEAGRLGLVRGCNPPENTRFCPHDTVTRAGLAVMLTRAAALPTPEGDHFADDDGHPAEAAIEALVAAGVTRGCGNGHFCPDRTLTRGELASLTTTALGLPSAGTGPYADLGSTPHGPALAMLGSQGYLEPCDPPLGRRMCPDQVVTRDEAVFVVGSALHLTPRPSRSEAAAPALDFADGFEDLALWDGRRVSGRNRVSLTDAGFEGRGLRVGIPRGSHYGADFRLDLDEVAGAEPEVLYFRYMLRLDPGWSPKWSGKLPGFSGVYGRAGKGGYRSTSSSPGWSARVQFFGTHANDDRARLGYYVYHLGQERRYGDRMMWNEAGKLRPGEWYCIEGEVDLNTPGLADGALRAWVDGTAAFDVAGIQFRRGDEPDIRIESFWFNVYYGGKPTAEESMGLTIDEVAVDTARIGCGGEERLRRTMVGDVTGNGFQDRLHWGRCPEGDCFELAAGGVAGREAPTRAGGGAWFTLDAMRDGPALGDFDGDSRADVVYRGRCGGSTACWRVHRSAGRRLGPGSDWGDGARFSPVTSGLVTGDWNGDGLDDLTYRGVCGRDAHPCWRAHLSTGSAFGEALDLGRPYEQGTAPAAADPNGDGRQDLVFQAACGEHRCWYVQDSEPAGFGPPRRLGRVRTAEDEWRRWFDLDGDGADDLVTVTERKGRGRLEARRSGNGTLGQTALLVEFDGVIGEVDLRRRPGQPLDVVVSATCGSEACRHHLVAWEDALITIDEFHRKQIMLKLFTGTATVG